MVNLRERLLAFSHCHQGKACRQHQHQSSLHFAPPAPFLGQQQNRILHGIPPPVSPLERCQRPFLQWRYPVPLSEGPSLAQQISEGATRLDAMALKALAPDGGPTCFDLRSAIRTCPNPCVRTPTPRGLSRIS